MAKKQKPQLTVVKNEKETTEPILNKPTPEEVEQFKVDFETEMSKFSETKFQISEVGQFPANDTAMFLLDYLKKYVLWTKTGWMCLIKMEEDLTKPMILDNEHTGLCFDFQALV
jgi:mannose-6-phosphate isomerase class I